MNELAITRKSRHYVNGPTMHKALLDWYESGTEEPPKEVVEAVRQICERLSHKHNFKNYTYLEEMIGDAKLACIVAVLEKKYDPYKWNNPFAYFTRIAYNAFINYIKIEHKETYIKHKELENYMVDAAIRGEDIEYKADDSGRLDRLVNKFEGDRNEED